MARRLRLRLPGRPQALGVVAAVVLVVALVLTGRSLNLGGSGHGAPAQPARAATVNTQAPYRIGTTVDCPPLWPVLAMSNHTSYPAGHPAKPPATATPIACYQTAAQAAGAGYPPAPLPAGAREIGGVYLTPTSSAFRTRCQQVADVLGFGAACPGLLPTLPPGLPPPQLCEAPASCRHGQPLVYAHQGFVVPFGYAGAPSAGGYGALAIVAAPTIGESGRLDPRCREEHQLATLTTHGTRAVLAACADDPQRSFFSGSVLLRWSEQGTSLVVSVLGHGEVNQRLVAAVADHLRLVRPRADSGMAPRAVGGGNRTSAGRP